MTEEAGTGVLPRTGQLKACVQGVTAAAVGAITGAVFVLGRQAVTDLATATLALAALAVLVSGKKVPELRPADIDKIVGELREVLPPK
jgi:hypothetical protein